MEENSTLAPAAIEPQQKTCISCGNPQILHGYPNALCEECRERYIKYPIPLWVKAFGSGLALMVLLLLFNLPKTLGTGIEYEKGVKAEDAKKYVTAQKQMEDVVQKTPSFLEAKAHLLIAAFYNHDLKTLGDMANQLSGKSFDDDALMGKTNSILGKGNSYFPSDAFTGLMKQYGDSLSNIPDSVYRKFTIENPDELFAKTLYASLLDAAKKYVACDSLLQLVLQKDAGYIPALQLMQGLKRVMNDTKASLEYCDQLLAINSESPYALAGKARTCLKLQQPKQALQYALQAYNINPEDDYAFSTLALAYHFNNMIKERDAFIEKAKHIKNPALDGDMQYVMDIITNKDKL